MELDKAKEITNYVLEIVGINATPNRERLSREIAEMF